MPQQGHVALDHTTVYRLPMRDGNVSGPAGLRMPFAVYRLPMRDGNLRTALNQYRLPVYRLPMRDGNQCMQARPGQTTISFIDYL